MKSSNKSESELQLNYLPSWLRAALLTLFALAIITLGAEATTIAKTNNNAGSVDDDVLTRTVTFVEDVDFTAGSAVQDVNVAINFEKIDGTCPTHGGGSAFNSEIYMYLISPAGTQVALVENALNSAGSGTGTTYPGTSYGGLVAVTFDDWAASTVGGAVPTSGTFKPVQPLSAFNGETPLGTWTLYVGDSAPGDPLCFYEYTLTIDGSQPPVVNNQSFNVVEQSANGTSIGTVVATDDDAGDKLTYTITAGNSAGIFALNKLTGEITVADGSQIDFEGTKSYDLTVQVMDSSGLYDTATITINVTNANDAPTDISLDNSSVLEHRPTGTLVGNLSTTDDDAGDSHTYSLVDTATYPDNGSFAIDGSRLESNAVFDIDIKTSYSIKIQTNDGNGGTYSEVFDIDIDDGNDPPTDISLDSTSVAENQSPGALVGNFSTSDPNVGDTHSYALVSGTGSTDNDSFQISGSQLQTQDMFDYEPPTSYSIRVRSTDTGTGNLWFEEVFTITITDENDQPTDISLDSSSVAENQIVGSLVGNFSTTDQDTGDSHTYTLVAGTGDTDNGSFQISIGTSELKTDDVFDRETKSSYSIRVRSTDAGSLGVEEVFTITITDANDAPTDISLDNNSVLEHQAVGTLVGNLSSTDQDSGDSHTYSLVDTATYPDNGSFAIDGSRLESNAVFDIDIKTSYSIKIQTNDGNGGTYSEVFDIDIDDGNDPPTDISLDSTSVAENQSPGALVGNFSTSDPNVGDTHSYALVSGTGSTDNDSFQISGSQLQTQDMFDYEPPTSYSIRVRSTDTGTGNLWFEEVFTITITDENDQPTDISLDSSSVAENQIVGSLVGNFSTTDQDTGDSHTYTLVAGTGDTDNGSFQISIGTSELKTDDVFDRETKSSYSIRVRSTDAGSLGVEEVFTITITDENEAPTDVSLSSSSVLENQPVSTPVGNLSTTDPDSDDSFTYSLVAGTGDTGNTFFKISGSQLQTNTMFDHETQGSYSVRIQTRDSGGQVFSEAFTITISNANDAPVGVDDTDSTDEDTVLTVAANGVLGNDQDQDGDTLTVMSADSSSAQGAFVNVASNGGFSYDPTAVPALQALNMGQSLDDTFSYMVIDGGIIFDTAVVTVTVSGVNDAPDAINDAVTTVLETAVIVSPLTNDTDPDTTDTKSIVSFTQGTHGSVTDSGSGTLTYTPESGYIGSDSFTYTMEDSHSANDTATINVTVNPKKYYVFLPTALNNYASAPDLVVTDIQANSDYVEVVIENQGSQATNSGFWVDFYINPSPAPLHANELWPALSTQGIAWGVTTSILPSEVLTLTYSTNPSAPNLYYSPADSLFSGSLPANTPVFAQVDSAHVGNPNGAILENHEITGGVYNNIFQSLAVATPVNTALKVDTPNGANTTEFNPLPRRH